MHILQLRILQKAASGDLNGKSLRDIGALIGSKYAQQVKHHLGELGLKGLLTCNFENKTYTLLKHKHNYRCVTCDQLYPSN